MKYAIWVASGLLTLAMFGSATAKMMGVPEVLIAFQQLGLPSWFPIFIATLYYVGALLLWVPKYAALGAGGLAVIMVAAFGYHALYTPIGEGVPALVLLALCGFLFWARRDQAFWSR